MEKICKLNKNFWELAHQKRQAELLDKVESGEISEIQAEYLDDMDNAFQGMSIRSIMFSLQN
jgi:hypothetical protein